MLLNNKIVVQCF